MNYLRTEVLSCFFSKPSRWRPFLYESRALSVRASMLAAAPRASIAPAKHSSRSSRRRNESVDDESELAPKAYPKTKFTRRRQKSPSMSNKPPAKIPISSGGITSSQFAALADADSNAIFKHAREIEPDLKECQALPSDVIELVAEQMGLNVTLDKRESIASMLRSHMDPKTKRSKTETSGRRMPVVTVMGHVDHGKTTLLDSLRSSNVAKNETGGITQSIAAFEVNMRDLMHNLPENSDERDQVFATFIDTPGHAAFSAMRLRGTVATDIVVLVVAADDGVMPQTVEAISLAKAAGVPIIVAINKCDKEGADPDRVRYQLLETTGLNTEQLGGDVQSVEVSATEKVNLDSLVESIILQSEMLNLRSEQGDLTEMVCIESRTDRNLGSVATVVVRSGVLMKGDIVVFDCREALSGDVHGRVRLLLDSNFNPIEQAQPGKAVGIVGLRTPVPPGAECVVVESEKMARKLSQSIIAHNSRAREAIDLAESKIAASQLHKDDSSTDPNEPQSDVASHTQKTRSHVSAHPDSKGKVLNVLVKGDVQGSADAVARCLENLSTADYRVRILGASVGDVCLSDVAVASATLNVKGARDDAAIVAFNVRLPEDVRRKAQMARLEILQQSLIYHLEDQMKERIAKAEASFRITETRLGQAKVARIFADGAVAGCIVNDGSIDTGSTAKVLRLPKDFAFGTEREVVHTGKIKSIKHFADKTESVSKGMECGIQITDWTNFLQGDIVETVKITKGGNNT